LVKFSYSGRKYIERLKTRKPSHTFGDIYDVIHGNSAVLGASDCQVKMDLYPERGQKKDPQFSGSTLRWEWL
jgi:hypothetical protein